ncbi:hypothetical protein C8R46DRAFT_217992 [Mycena filopes]|nr:hypothetical protein C8R46DRAFT_217992 [Mycena filopes]
MWEIADRTCSSGCGFEFDIDALDDAEFINSNEGYNPDRVSTPRGGTPLRELEQYVLPPNSSPYSIDSDEYEQLRRRGATRLMCETFHLQFDSDTGITAWADGDLYDEFSGPLMQQGDFWKIMLGRRIQLDDDDLDGSGFMEALLEDVLLFPLPNFQWETVEDSPGLWVTRKPADVSADSESDTLMDEGTQEERVQGADALAVQEHNYETSDEEDVDGVDSEEPDEDSDDGYICRRRMGLGCWC